MHGLWWGKRRERRESGRHKAPFLVLPKSVEMVPGHTWTMPAFRSPGGDGMRPFPTGSHNLSSDSVQSAFLTFPLACQRNPSGI